ncbi:MAG: DUF401 family protein, partial [Planctomycetota bacterium]|nr:DUF401 family protein [Planctomycetota bacterium]
MVLLKIGLIFVLLILLLRLRIPFSISILFTSLLLGLSFRLDVDKIGESTWVTLRETQTLSLCVIVAVILVLSEILQASGQLTDIGRLTVNIVGEHRFTYTILPILVGLLPMPGGALFTAPLMDTISENKIAPHNKTLINYWFRHIWEYAWPLYPGFVLAAELSKVPLNALSLFNAPFVVVSALIGILFIFRSMKITHQSSSAVPSRLYRDAIPNPLRSGDGLLRSGEGQPSNHPACSAAPFGGEPRPAGREP